jgi:WD40 repeat protein
MWNATSLQPIRAVYASHPLWSVAVNPNEPEILTASGGYDNSLQLWDANSLTPKNAPMVGHKGYLLYDAGYSTDGKSIVSGSNDGFVRVWNAQTREVTQQLSVDQNAAITVAFAPNGQWIVSGGNDNTLRLWDTEKYKPIGGPVEGHTSSILTGAVRPDSARMLSSGRDGTLRLWPAPGDFVTALCGKINNVNMSREQWNKSVEGIDYTAGCPGA